MPIVYGTDKEPRVNTWLAIAWCVGGLLLIMVLWIGLASAVWGLRVATAGIYGRGEARIQIQSAASRIGAYNHFFNLCAAVQSQEASVAALTTQLDGETDPKTRDRLATSLTGVSAQRERSIAQYNADARKDYTIGQFRDSDLPYQLDAKAEETPCGFQ
jgi:hypothetical protein